LDIRILVINPVATEIWNQLTYEFLKPYADKETEIVVRNIKYGPPAIECFYDKVTAAPYVIKEVDKAQEEGYNSIIINCFDDPGLEASREISSIPVLGIGETSITFALMLAYKIGIVSTGIEAKLAYYKKAQALGIRERVAYATGIDIEVLSLRKDLDKVKKLLLEEIKKAKNEGAGAVVLGCGGFIGLYKELTEASGIPIIDPTLATFKIAESIARMGLSHSSLYLFNRIKHPYNI